VSTHCGIGGFGHAHALGQGQGLSVGQADQRIDEDLEDLFRGLVGHFFDVHAAFVGGHHGDGLGGAVGQRGNVVFVLDVSAFLDQQVTNLLAFGAGLVRDKLHAEDLAGVLAHFFQRVGDLDATALATATGVNLGLDDPDLAAQGFSCLDCVIDGRAVNPARNRNAEFLQEFFALIFVNFHGCPSIEVFIPVLVVPHERWPRSGWPQSARTAATRSGGSSPARRQTSRPPCAESPAQIQPDQAAIGRSDCSTGIRVRHPFGRGLRVKDEKIPIDSYTYEKVMNRITGLSHTRRKRVINILLVGQACIKVEETVITYEALDFNTTGMDTGARNLRVGERHDEQKINLGLKTRKKCRFRLESSHSRQPTTDKTPRRAAKFFRIL
jgi:hypothetical protein